MKLNKLETKLLTDLFKSTEGLYIYTLYQRYNLSPKELFLAIETLKENNFAELDDIRISISKEGIAHAVNTNIRLPLSTERFAKVPLNFIGPKIEINQFYIPKINIEKK